MRNKSDQLKWLESEIRKDQNELSYETTQFINNIKQIKKEDIFKKVEVQPKPIKLTLWQRIKKVLMG